MVGMDEFIEQRLAFLRGFDSQDPYWLQTFEGVRERVVHELGATNTLDLFLLSVEQGDNFDARLNKAWYAATYSQAEEDLDSEYDDSYCCDGCRYGSEIDDYYNERWTEAPADAWKQEDSPPPPPPPEEPVGPVEPNFVRQHGHIWRIGHQRKRKFRRNR